MIVKVENPEALRKRLAEKRLVLYGMGTLGMKIAGWLDSQRLSYVFADKKAGEKKETTKKTVVLPEELSRNYPDANIVISTNLYFEEVKEGLLKDGFLEEQILPYTLFVPQNVVWSDLEDNIDWERMRPSVELFSGWIAEDAESVIDYGAGQMYVRTFLKPQVKYYPIDYMKRFEETIVCDLNTGKFPEFCTDVAVLNGVLEFLTSAEELMRHVCEKTKRQIILSYMVLDDFSDIGARRASGYVSDLTEEKIIRAITEGGFRLVKKDADPLNAADRIYLFER